MEKILIHRSLSAEKKTEAAVKELQRETLTQLETLDVSMNFS